MKSKNLHIMLMVTTLGDGYNAPITEICAKTFDPETGELGHDHLTCLMNVKRQLKEGKPSPGHLENWMLARKYDLLIFNNPDYFATLSSGVFSLREFIETELDLAGLGWEHLLIYNLYPAYQLPRLTVVDQDILMSERSLWPSYGVRCAKTIQDLARPMLVEHGVDLPVRPPSRGGISDECDYQATLTMHSLLMLQRQHPTQLRSKPVKPQIPPEEDDEL